MWGKIWEKGVLIAAVGVLLIALGNLFAGGGKIYQLDLFSAISFGLAIAALILSMFAAWLSWEFYKKSTEALDEVKAIVSGVESAVIGVQSNITEIVKTAVKHWTQGVTSDDDLREQINQLKNSYPDIDGRLDALVEELASAKAQAIFPSGNFGNPNIRVENSVRQEVDCDDAEKLTGRVIFKIGKPTKNASYCLRTDNLVRAKVLNLKLLEYPSNLSIGDIRITQGFDQHDNVNIHLSGKVAEGQYVVEFSAP